MKDITKIPLAELEKDLLDSRSDINVCKLALLQNITNCGTGKVEDRLNKNRQFVTMITNEIARRAEEPTQ